jgi:hypothetical protein
MLLRKSKVVGEWEQVQIGLLLSFIPLKVRSRIRTAT